MAFLQLLILPVGYVAPGFMILTGFVSTLGSGLWRLNASFIRKNTNSIAQAPVNKNELAIRCSQLEEQLTQLETEKSTLAEELELRSRELTTQALNLLQKNALMEEVRSMVAEMAKDSTASLQPQKVSYNRLMKLIDYSFTLDKEWEDFKIYFEQVHQSFFVRLKEICPDLTPGELRLCALVKLNLNLKESATILKISPDSVKTARYRLRKKLNIPEEQTLTDFLLTLY